MPDDDIIVFSTLSNTTFNSRICKSHHDMKLFGCGFIATTDVTDKDDEIHRVRGTLKIVSDLECNYTILPIWGGVYVKNKCETSTWGLYI